MQDKDLYNNDWDYDDPSSSQELIRRAQREIEYFIRSDEDWLEALGSAVRALTRVLERSGAFEAFDLVLSYVMRYPADGSLIERIKLLEMQVAKLHQDIALRIEQLEQRSEQQRAENNQQAAENDRLRAENQRLVAEIARIGAAYPLPKMLTSDDAVTRFSLIELDHPSR